MLYASICLSCFSYAQSGEAPKLLWELKDVEIINAKLSNDGNYVFALGGNLIGSTASTIYKIDANTGAILKTFSSKIFMNKIITTSNDRFVYATLYKEKEETIIKVDMEELKVDTIINKSYSTSIKLSNDEKYIITSSEIFDWMDYRYELNVIDIAKKEMIETLDWDVDNIIKLNHANNLILNYTYYSDYFHFSLDSMRAISFYTTGQQRAAESNRTGCLWMSISNDDRYVASTAGDLTLAIYDLVDQKVVFKEKLFENYLWSKAVFFDNSDYILLGGQPGLRIYNWKTKKVIYSGVLPGGRFISICNNKIICDFGYTLNCISYDSTTLGINEKINEVSIKSMSPFRDLLQIELNTNKEKNILLITDGLGKIVYNKEQQGPNNQSIEINSGAWTPGIYIISLINDAGTKSLKVIKE